MRAVSITLNLRDLAIIRRCPAAAASTFFRTDLLWARGRYLQALANAVQVYIRPCCWQVSLASPIFTLSPPHPFA